MVTKGVQFLILALLILTGWSEALAESCPVAVSVSCDDLPVRGMLKRHLVRGLSSIDGVVVVEKAEEAKAELRLVCSKTDEGRIIIAVMKLQHASPATINPKTLKSEYFIDRVDHYVSVVAKDELEQFSSRVVSDFRETFLEPLLPVKGSEKRSR